MTTVDEAREALLLLAGKVDAAIVHIEHEHYGWAGAALREVRNDLANLAAVRAEREGLVVTFAMLERAIRTALPADMVYAYAPHGDPFSKWAQALYGNLVALATPPAPELDR